VQLKFTFVFSLSRVVQVRQSFHQKFIGLRLGGDTFLGSTENYDIFYILAGKVWSDFLGSKTRNSISQNRLVFYLPDRCMLVIVPFYKQILKPLLHCFCLIVVLGSETLLIHVILALV